MFLKIAPMFAADGLRRRVCRRLRGLAATDRRRRLTVPDGLLRRRVCRRFRGLAAVALRVRRRPVAALRFLVAIVFRPFVFVAINPLGLWTRTTFI